MYFRIDKSSLSFAAVCAVAICFLPFGRLVADATDVRGEGYPRLRDGRVHIGCYQCWLDPIGSILLVR